MKKLLTKHQITLIILCFCCIMTSLFCSGVWAGDKASFVSETIPDNTKVTGGSSFNKTWTIKNAGDTTWTSSYKLKYVSNQGGRLSSTSEVKISGSVSPGKSYTFSVPMKAPAAQSSEKTYREDWKFTNASGSTIKVGSSSTVWALIKVPAAAPLPTTDKASLVSETIPDNTKVTGGSSFNKTWTIKNSGTSTWTSSYKLKYVSDSGGRLSSISEVKISGSVSPGNSYTFTVSMKAPAAQSSEKTYREDWKFTNASGSTINVGSSSTVWAIIKVPAAAPPPTTDKASLVSETIPDNTKVTGGSSFNKTWTIKNSGTSTWTSSYKLSYATNQGGRLSSISEVKISGSVSPGNSYTFTVPMKAPAAQSSEKTYREDWKFTNSSGSTINVGSSSTVWALIKVPAASSGGNAAKGLQNALNNLNKTSGYVTWNGITSYGIWADSSYTYCARFARMCYGEPARFNDAISIYNYLNGLKLINKGTNPPAGAVVFYDKHSENGNYGHTGIADGNGKLYSVTSTVTGVNLTGIINYFKAAYLGYVTADTFIDNH